MLLLPLMVLANVYFVANSLMDVISIGLLMCVGILLGYSVAGMDIRAKDKIEGRRGG